ncbi:MAG: glutamate synthase subunit beta [Clostridia bacterium]|nr:glutamate synthase subunit beta [Clostridia bacterium]
MGKPTGFLDYNREGNPSIEPKKRIKNFNEFHGMLSAEERRLQGARCMNCGVPFCQSGMMLHGMATGCPLHNLIPEWNDEIYKNNWEHALSRLLKTSNFPEFTGRVCPALCEAACTCGMNDTPVTVKENELALIENGFKNGLVKPRIPKVRSDKRIAVIGSGPSGLAVADSLNQRGHNVTVYEKNDRIGGLLMYGIPNMKLEKQIVDRRVKLMKEEGIEFITNADVGNTVDAKELMNAYDAVVLCCGAGHARDINAEGRQGTKGIYFAVDFLTMNTKSLLDSNFKDGKYVKAKDKNVVIIGGGDTGNDCTGTVIRHGCKSVTQIEMMPKLPDTRAANNPWPQWPRVCKTDYGQEEAIAVFGHDPRIYETTVKEIISDENGNIKAVKTVKLKQEKNPETGMMSMKEIAGSEQVLDCDLLIIAAGFLGCNKYIADAFGVELNARTNIKTGADSYKTNVDKVFTAGDMHRGQSLVVWGIAEGRAAAKEIDTYLMGYSNMV